MVFAGSGAPSANCFSNIRRMSAGVGPEPEEIDSETLLAQGDELLKSSRRLLDELDDTIDLREPPEGV